MGRDHFVSDTLKCVKMTYFIVYRLHNGIDVLLSITKSIQNNIIRDICTTGPALIISMHCNARNKKRKHNTHASSWLHSIDPRWAFLATNSSCILCSFHVWYFCSFVVFVRVIGLETFGFDRNQCSTMKRISVRARVCWCGYWDTDVCNVHESVGSCKMCKRMHQIALSVDKYQFYVFSSQRTSVIESI